LNFDGGADEGNVVPSVEEFKESDFLDKKIFREAEDENKVQRNNTFSTLPTV